MKKLMLAFVFCLAMSFPVEAFTVIAPDNTFSVPILGSREIEVVVGSSFAETIAVSIIDAKPWLSVSETQLSVRQGSPQTVKLIVSPHADTFQGLYKVSLLFESLNTKELKKADLYVFVDKSNIVNVEKISVTGDLAPLGAAKIDVHVKNLKTITATNVAVTLNVSSPFGTLSYIEKSVDRLDPGQEAVVTETVFFDKFVPPSTHTADATVRYADETTRLIQTFFVGSKAVILKVEETSPTLMGQSRRILVTNYGNEIGSDDVSQAISAAEYLFMAGDRPDSKTGDFYYWHVANLLPGETRIIEYRIDFAPLLLFIAAIAVLAWVFVFKYKTVHLRKYIIQKKRIEEGEEFTVALEVHNNSGTPLNVEVSDFVPAAFKVKEGHGPKHQSKRSNVGVELNWSVKNLHNRETRILTYKIDPMFGVSGTIKLPKAAASFELRKRKWESRSLHASVGIHDEEENVVLKRKE